MLVVRKEVKNLGVYLRVHIKGLSIVCVCVLNALLERIREVKAVRHSIHTSILFLKSMRFSKYSTALPEYILEYVDLYPEPFAVYR